MTNPIDNAVDAAFDNNASKFQDAVTSVLFDKLKERIGVEKVVVAQNYFNDSVVDDDYEDHEETEVADEDF